MSKKMERPTCCEVGRSGGVLLGGSDAPDNKQTASKKQAASSPQTGFPHAIARAEGPRLAQPAWYATAAALAREPEAETAFSAAIKRALEQRGQA